LLLQQRVLLLEQEELLAGDRRVFAPTALFTSMMTKEEDAPVGGFALSWPSSPPNSATSMPVRGLFIAGFMTKTARAAFNFL